MLDSEAVALAREMEIARRRRHERRVAAVWAAIIVALVVLTFVLLAMG